MMKLLYLILAAGVAFAQTTRYPGALDSDSSLFVVSDNVQTTLNTAMAIADNTAVVASAAGFVPNMIATICDTTTSSGKCTTWEHMLVTGVAGNVLTVTRGFAGTSARTHSSGRLVSALIDSAHQKVLKDSVVAIETALGPNFKSSAGLVTAGTYTFSPYSCNSSSTCTPGGSSGMGLIAGNNTLTMQPVPQGVNGSDTGHSLYVSGGTGAAEACLITGGGGTAGQASGQVIVNCPHAHSGAWTIGGATGGIQEAICSFPSTGGTVIVQQSVALTANVTDCGKTGTTSVNTQAGVTLSGAFTIFGNPLGDGDAQIIYTKAMRGYGAFSFGSGFTPQADMMVMDYTVTAAGTGSPGWGPAATNFRVNASAPVGTFSVLDAQLLITNNTSSNGSAAVEGYAYVGSGTTSIVIGVHGECDVQWAGGPPTCVAHNAEGSTVAGSSAQLIGYVANMNSAMLGTPTVYGLDVIMNHSSTNPGAGGYIHAENGTHAAGLFIQEGVSGKFTNGIALTSNQSTNNRLLMYNGHSGTAIGNPNQIIFGKGPDITTNAVGMISSDIGLGGSYLQGNVDIYAAFGGTLRIVGSFNYLGHLLLGNGSPVVDDNTNVLQVAGPAAVTGNLTVGGGGNTVFRCATAGALPTGALTTVGANCGTTADTGVRVK